MKNPGPVEECIGGEIEPPAGGEVHAARNGLHGVIEDRRNQQVAAEEELVVDRRCDGIVGELERQRTHHRQPAS